MPSHRDAGDPSLRSLRRRFPPGDSLRHLAREAFHATAPPSALAPSHAVVHLDICSGSGRCRRRSQSTATTLLPVHHLRLPSLSTRKEWRERRAALVRPGSWQHIRISSSLERSRFLINKVSIWHAIVSFGLLSDWIGFLYCNLLCHGKIIIQFTW
uniref:Uncharacterized protein n=1 Tax=Oryza nivara TaxID=4536 RepID=A0A0E0IR07_ORYNI